jgi:hypothetical protein
MNLAIGYAHSKSRTSPGPPEPLILEKIMASNKKKTASKSEQRRLRTQQIIFIAIAAIIIFTWIASLIGKY